MKREIHTDHTPAEPADERPDPSPHPDHHDGDDDEWLDVPDAHVTVETAGAHITVSARGETAVHDCRQLLDAAIEAAGRLRVQMQ